MNIINACHPRYNEDGSIDVIITTDSILGVELPFTASPNDTEIHGRELYEDLVKGKYGNILPFSRENNEKKLLVKNQWAVEQKIKLSDNVIRTLSEEKEAGVISEVDLERWKQWICYRKKLREIDINLGHVDWPDQPQ